jgi:predicted kinase
VATTRASDVYIVVSGAPGSGKTTVARELARVLDVPLFSKDTIKEALLDSLGANSVADSQRLGAAAIRTLLALAADNGCGVLESTWQASLATADLRRLPAPIVEVFCDVDPEIARERYRARASVRHPGHFDDVHGRHSEFWASERARPIDGGWPVVRLDTARPVDIDELYSRVQHTVENS